MAYTLEFPDFPEADMPGIPAGFTDISWRNDVCPSFSNDAAGLVVFIDFLDKPRREFPESERFTVMGWDGEGLASPEAGSPPDLFGSDDWQAVVAFMVAHKFAAILKQWATAEEWETMLAANVAAPNDMCCASHDFCDANMAMLEAFTAVMGRAPIWECDADDKPADERAGTIAAADADLGLINAAWAYAKPNFLTAKG